MNKKKSLTLFYIEHVVCAVIVRSPGYESNTKKE